MSQSSKRTRQRARIDMKAVGRRIRELRGFDLTQVEVAMRIGVVQSHLSALERGDTQPCAEVLVAISREFGRSVDWLLTGEEFTDRVKRPAAK